MSAPRLGTMLPGEKDPVVQVVVRPPVGMWAAQYRWVRWCNAGAHQPLRCQKESIQYARCFLHSDP